MRQKSEPEKQPAKEFLEAGKKPACRRHGANCPKGPDGEQLTERTGDGGKHLAHHPVGYRAAIAESTRNSRLVTFPHLHKNGDFTGPYS